MLENKHFKSKYNIDIEKVKEIKLVDSNIQAIEDNGFHGAVLLSRLNLKSNLIKKINNEVFNCGHCSCLGKLRELDLSNNQITEIQKKAFETDVT